MHCILRRERRQELDRFLQVRLADEAMGYGEVTYSDHTTARSAAAGFPIGQPGVAWVLGRRQALQHEMPDQGLEPVDPEGSERMSVASNAEAEPSAHWAAVAAEAVPVLVAEVGP